MAALEVRAGTFFKELGAQEGTRWLREVDMDLFTMSGEKWVLPEFTFLSHSNLPYRVSVL